MEKTFVVSTAIVANVGDLADCGVIQKNANDVALVAAVMMKMLKRWLQPTPTDDDLLAMDLPDAMPLFMAVTSEIRNQITVAATTPTR